MKNYNLKLNIPCFNLKFTLECGQCFRWKKTADYTEEKPEYIGVIFDRVIKIMQDGDEVYISSDKQKDLEEVVRNYFDFNTDYVNLERKISDIDNNIFVAVSNSSGIRILNQPHFETLISYIISSNNNIPRITRSVHDLSKKYGKKVFFEDEEYFLFPTAEELSHLCDDEFMRCGVGFRARYLKHTVEDVLTGKIDLSELEMLSNLDAKKQLLVLKGVGPKVADCVLLFSYQRGDIFPIDVWVKRIMEKLYFRKNVTLQEILDYADKNFGVYSGIVQQHLFYNVREGNM